MKEAIILAGGLGTRLREAVPELPKCMAPVASRPFLYHVVTFLQSQGVEKFIFSLGYKHEVIERWLADDFPCLCYQSVIETEPLGTGGAIRLACQHATEENVVVMNGDTMFKVDIERLAKFHQDQQAECTLALKPMENFERYGVVETDNNGWITSFREKQHYDKGLVNGGVYAINIGKLLKRDQPLKFSFEKDYLEKNLNEHCIAALSQDAYFIDIGIPEDFQRAQKEFQNPPLDLKKIDRSWTLFLDRDGVINEDKPGSYIFSTDEFVFMQGMPGGFKKLSEKFGKLIVATNQRGVGRKLMTEDTLTSIHQKMQKGIEEAGGRMDAIYYATGIDNKDPFRKPNPGMAVRARTRFPEIEFSKSIMVGNNISDMQFGRAAGMYTVFLRTTSKHIQLPHPDIDEIYDSLEEFVKAL